MSRSDDERCADILHAIHRCQDYAHYLHRNLVVHEYFRVNPELITDIVDHELVDLASAIRTR